MRKFFFLIRTLPDPAPYETVLRSRVRPLVAANEYYDAPHVAEDHGASWDASAIIDATTADTLAYPGVLWASAIEPAGVSANLDDRVQAMGLAEDGTFVYDTTLLDHGMLRSAYELGYPFSSVDWCGAPLPRTGFVPVLSRSAGGLFVIGGRDAGTNALTHEIFFFRPHLGWSQISSSIEFGDIKSATYSAVDGKLWLLERRTSSYTLLRISPWTGVAEQLGSYPRGAVWDQHFLAMDRDGRVLLVASSLTSNRSKVGQLRVNGSGQAYASKVDEESIPYTTLAPIVDKDEYGFIVRDGAGGVTSIYRRASLLGGTGNYPLGQFFQ